MSGLENNSAIFLESSRVRAKRIRIISRCSISKKFVSANISIIIFNAISSIQIYVVDVISEHTIAAGIKTLNTTIRYAIGSSLRRLIIIFFLVLTKISLFL